MSGWTRGIVGDRHSWDGPNGESFPCDVNGWIDIAHAPTDPSEYVLVIDEKGKQDLGRRVGISPDYSVTAQIATGYWFLAVAWKPLGPGRADTLVDVAELRGAGL